MSEVLANLQREIEEMTLQERSYAPWMAQVLIALPKDPAYKKLTPQVREEIETIIAAIE